jgi:hypothetical protein
METKKKSTKKIFFTVLFLVSVNLFFTLKIIAGDKIWVNTGLQNRNVLSIMVVPNEPEIIFAGTDEGVYRSQDGGASWDLVLNEGNVYVIVYDQYAYGYDCIGCGTEDGFFYSDVDGDENSWFEYGNWNDVFSILYGAPGGNEHEDYLCGTYDGIHSSGNALYPENVNPNKPVYSIVKTNVGGSCGAEYNIAASDGVWSSTGCIISWYYGHSGKDYWRKDNSVVSQNVYFLTTCPVKGYGTKRSILAATDDGIQGYKNTLPGIPISYIVLEDPQRLDVIYTSSGNPAPYYGYTMPQVVDPQGVFKTTDGGINWEPINDGLPDLNVITLAVSSDKTLFAGTEKGIFKFVEDNDPPTFSEYHATTKLANTYDIDGPYTIETTVTDNVILGVKEANIVYKLNSSNEISEPMAPVHNFENYQVLRGNIPFQSRSTTISYRIEAKDAAGNTASTAEYSFNILEQIPEADRYSILLLGTDRVNTASKLRHAGHQVNSGLGWWYLEYLEDFGNANDAQLRWDQIWYMDHNNKPSEKAEKVLKKYIQLGGNLFICGDNYQHTHSGKNIRRDMADWRDGFLNNLGAGGIKQSEDNNPNSGPTNSVYDVSNSHSISNTPVNVNTIWHEPGGNGSFSNNGKGKTFVTTTNDEPVAVAFNAGDLSGASASKVVAYLNSNNSSNWCPLAANIAHFLGASVVKQNFKILVVGFDRVNTAAELEYRDHEVTRAGTWVLSHWDLSQFDQVWYVDAFNVPAQTTEAATQLTNFMKEGGHVFFAGDSYKSSYHRIALMNWRDTLFNDLGAGGVKQSTTHKTGKMFYTDPEHSMSKTPFFVTEVGQESEGYGFFESTGKSTEVVGNEADATGNTVAIAFNPGDLTSATESKAVIFLNSNCSTNWTFLAANIAHFLGKKASVDISKQFAKSNVFTEENLEEKILPKDYEISQNYPNPFNPETDIKYQLPVKNFVTIKIFNMLGKEINSLVNEFKPAGYHFVCWDGKDSFGNKVVSGIYLYQVKAGDFVCTRKMALMK